jgi:GNAT superfamily N-acetyltransferase
MVILTTMAKLPFEVREYREDEIPAIVSLLAEHLCLPRFDEAYFRWKYLDNPNGRGICIVALVGDRVVGVSGLIPYEGVVQDHHCRIWFGTDSLVHPDYRRQGIFSAMVTEQNNIAKGRGADVVFCFTSTMSHQGFLKTRAYSEAGLLDYDFTLVRPWIGS